MKSTKERREPKAAPRLELTNKKVKTFVEERNNENESNDVVTRPGFDSGVSNTTIPNSRELFFGHFHFCFDRIPKVC